MANDLQVSYQVGLEKVVLNATVVRDYLVSGNGKVSDQEIIMFMKLCKARNLNPWTKEAYLVKYGSEKAAIIIGKDAFLKRAQANPKYEGHEVEVSEDGQSATCRVYVEGYRVPISVTLDLDEYVGRKSDGTINSQWTRRPRTMLRKCALVAGLREAFTEDLGGLYSADEIQGREEVKDIVQPEEVRFDSKQSEVKKGGTKPLSKENLKWLESWSPFLDTLGHDAFHEVLDALGYKTPEEVPPAKRGEVFEAWSIKAAECL